jgi:hypothetical protein
MYELLAWMRYTCETCVLCFCIFSPMHARSLKKKVNFDTKNDGSFLADAKENAERSWTPPLVRSISRTHNVTAESVVVIF